MIDYPIFHDMSKCYFIRNLVNGEVVELQFCSINRQTYIMKKGLEKDNQEHFGMMIGVKELDIM